MKKKLVKAIVWAACVTGIISSVPFITTSCGKSGGDQPVPPGPGPDPIIDKLVQTELSDWENSWSYINFSDSGKSKFTTWEQQGINGVKLPLDECASLYPPAQNWPSFMHILEVPSQIKEVFPYLSGSYSENLRFNKNITKIIFDSETLKIWKNSTFHPEGPFDESKLLNTIVFNNITSLNLQEDIDFSQAGVDSPYQCRIIFGANVTDDNVKTTIFNTLLEHGLPSKWTHN